jgi:thiol-disulfide isomerase/thioredoxin
MSSRTFFMLIVGLTLSGFVVIAFSKTVLATPAFSQQTGEPCTTCHDIIPKLNHTGQNFRTNGFRLPAIKEQKTDRDLQPVPRPAELGIEAKPEPADRSIDEPPAIPQY